MLFSVHWSQHAFPLLMICGHVHGSTEEEGQQGAKLILVRLEQKPEYLLIYDPPPRSSIRSAGPVG